MIVDFAVSRLVELAFFVLDTSVDEQWKLP